MSKRCKICTPHLAADDDPANLKWSNNAGPGMHDSDDRDCTGSTVTVTDEPFRVGRWRLSLPARPGSRRARRSRSGAAGYPAQNCLRWHAAAQARAINSDSASASATGPRRPLTLDQITAAPAARARQPLPEYHGPVMITVAPARHGKQY